MLFLSFYLIQVLGTRDKGRDRLFDIKIASLSWYIIRTGEHVVPDDVARNLEAYGTRDRNNVYFE